MPSKIRKPVCSSCNKQQNSFLWANFLSSIVTGLGYRKQEDLLLYFRSVVIYASQKHIIVEVAKRESIMKYLACPSVSLSAYFITEITEEIWKEFGTGDYNES
jgi:hypothetical protein